MRLGIIVFVSHSGEILQKLFGVFSGCEHQKTSGGQRKVFTTPLLSEAKSHRNTNQFTKKKSRCQRGGVRGVANQNATTERTILQTKGCSKDEAAALRKNHVGRPYAVGWNRVSCFSQRVGIKFSISLSKAK